MAGATPRERTTKEYWQTKAVQLYVKFHCSQYKICEILEKEDGIKLDNSTISKYLKSAREEWRNARIEDMDAVFERELAELDEMEMQSAKLFVRFAEHLDDDDPYLSSKEASEWIKARLKIKEQRQKLLGMNSPIKMQHSGTVAINLTVADCGEDGGFEPLPEDD